VSRSLSACSLLFSVSFALAASACGGAVAPNDGGSNDGAVTNNDSATVNEAGVDPLDIPAQCTTNTRWTGGNRGSRSMNPGQACIACHVTDRRAPPFSVAGTVYQTGHEPNNCNGGAADPIEIEITDSTGMVYRYPANAVGNFYANDAITPPYTARVLYQGRVRAMRSRQDSGDCNSCHTDNGTMGAPGRVTVP
jgi:hypothetical protein